MRAVSGILITDPDNVSEGVAVIDLNDLPHDGASVGDAKIYQVIQSGDAKRFNTTPAYIVSVRAWRVQDDTKDNLFTKSLPANDSFNIDSRIDKNRLRINWAPTRSSEGGNLHELSFMVVGN